MGKCVCVCEKERERDTLSLISTLKTGVICHLVSDSA